jgi:hydrogenase assembly chaperone HypC/HupF
MLRHTELAPRCEPEGHCVTCGDDGVPMRVVALDSGEQLATCVDEAGAHSSVAVELVPPVGPGDMVLVHAGVAIARLEEGAR